MTHRTKPVTIQIADDDLDDRCFTHVAFDVTRLANELRFAEV